MKTQIQVLATLVLGILAGGCAAPSSGVVRVRVSGRIVDSLGQPAAQQQVDILLPSQYGLTGLDAVWGKPEDYGHRDQKARVTTDENGQFEHAFAPTTYSIVFWFIPPLGPIPRKPPDPYFYLKLPSQTNEFWVLWMRKYGLETRLIERGNRTPIEQSQFVPAEFSGELIWEGLIGEGEVSPISPRGYLVDFQMKLLSETDNVRANKAIDSDKQ